MMIFFSASSKIDRFRSRQIQKISPFLFWGGRGGGQSESINRERASKILPSFFLLEKRHVKAACVLRIYSGETRGGVSGRERERERTKEGTSWGWRCGRLRGVGATPSSRI